MDRNKALPGLLIGCIKSLSARRAWIEIDAPSSAPYAELVALRKESVDRNTFLQVCIVTGRLSLSARRAWIEIGLFGIDTISY